LVSEIAKNIKIQFLDNKPLEESKIFIEQNTFSELENGQLCLNI